MPRRNQRHRPPAGDAAPLTGWTRTESDVDGDWTVRTISGTQARKTYRCPGCDHEIRPGTPHVVAWPADEGSVTERRHWHSPCWAARHRRRPNRR